jgi:8-oxo-dGTP pyrophosphatase MutT (NUDIX family)
MSNDLVAGEENVEHERKVNRRRNVAVVGLRDGDGKILMIRTARLPSRWQPIGGGMDPNDGSPIETLVREVTEELGIELQPEDFRPVIQAPYDFGEGTVYFFEANADPAAEEFSYDENEIIEYRWVDLVSAKRLQVFPATAKFLDALS